MEPKLKVMAIVAARENSKRLPGKNIKDFNGLPLITYTLNAITDSNVIAKSVISTDSESVKSIARRAGFKNIHQRDQRLASDTAIVYDTVKEVIINEPNLHDYIMLLSPTNPLRNFEHIVSAVNIAKEKDADFVISVTPCSPIEYHNKINDNGTITGFLEEENFGKRVQDFQQTYKLSASIYLGKREHWLSDKSFFSYEKTYPIVIKNDIDIDTYADFKMAEELDRRRAKIWIE